MAASSPYDRILRIPARVGLGPEARTVLAGDWVFWASLLMLAVGVAPYVVPLLDAGQFWEWRWSYGDVPIAFGAFLAAIVGIGRVRGRAERRFWQLVAFAYGAALLAEFLSTLVQTSAGDIGLHLAVESLYLVYILALFVASGVRPDYYDSAGWRLTRLRAAGLGGLALGLAIYFQIVPSAASADSIGPGHPNLYVFALLDLALVLTFVRACRDQEDVRWRRIFAGMAAVSAVQAVLDASEATLYLEAFYEMEIPPAWDLPWFVPNVMFVFIARRHLGDPEHRSLPAGRRYEPRPDRGMLIGVLASLPLLHFLLYAAGVLDPSLRDLREGILVLYLLCMGALALLYLSTLDRERERGTRELGLSEERYRSFVTSRSDRMYRAEANHPIRLDQPRDTLLKALEHDLVIAEADEVPGRATSVADPVESIGRPLVDVLGPDSAHAHRILREWIDSGYDLENFELSEPGPHGEPHYNRYSVIGIVEDAGLVRVWATASDVTDQRLAALETERLERELEHAQKMESIGAFAGGIAHDFNNLLLPIIGFTELAVADTGAEDEATRESLGQVLRASHRAADLVNQVLSVSRVQPRGDVAVRTQDVIREALGLIRPGLPTTLRIETSIDDACPPILGDPSRIHQVLMNLSSNAAQAIGSAHGSISISLRHDDCADPLAAPKGWVVLEVTDDGPGVAPKVLDRVFEPFFTTRTASGGTGLGLSVVHGIVTSYGGQVTIASPAGQGARVTVRIPATDGVSSTGVADDCTPSTSLRVLVVDDEEAVAEVTHLMLQSGGHAAVSETDPAAALERIKAAEGRFDVLLTDYTMPGMTGLELARAALSCDPRLRVVIMSGFRLGSTDPGHGLVHLPKPFTSDELMATLGLAMRSDSDQGSGADPSSASRISPTSVS
ncbi:MAG: ATP-binding protein [Gemmatimonadota bacterium]|nr:ATP-binding protein [Gemmatimonadota bacterium]MDH3423085.1 ATP-binding protein [Gemmatimonadota bacterium]